MCDVPNPQGARGNYSPSPFKVKRTSGWDVYMLDENVKLYSYFRGLRFFRDSVDIVEGLINGSFDLLSGRALYLQLFYPLDGVHMLFDCINRL